MSQDKNIQRYSQKIIYHQISRSKDFVFLLFKNHFKHFKAMLNPHPDPMARLSLFWFFRKTVSAEPSHRAKALVELQVARFRASHEGHREVGEGQGGGNGNSYFAGKVFFFFFFFFLGGGVRVYFWEDVVLFFFCVFFRGIVWVEKRFFW